jgi:hypothetical protein
VHAVTHVEATMVDCASIVEVGAELPLMALFPMARAIATNALSASAPIAMSPPPRRAASSGVMSGCA